MKARMKFLIQSLGWQDFVATLDAERRRVGPIRLDELYELGSRPEVEPLIGKNGLRVIDPRVMDPGLQSWVHDAVVEHKHPRFRGVHVRLKLGDITSDRARDLAEIARRFSADKLRISIDQNIYLPWVLEDKLGDLYDALRRFELADRGVDTIADVTTCPGSDTCRLGIASAKGLGSAISDAFNDGLSQYREIARDVKIKVSGCPNGCAQHTIAGIGFHAAALSRDGRTVPAYLLTLGGRTTPDSAQIGHLIGKFPARNGVKVIETLLSLYEKEKLPVEEFNSFCIRQGEARFQKLLEPLRRVPSFAEDANFYQDYGHEHERFAVRAGVKGECAGSTVAEEPPTIDRAREWLAQADAFIYHREYEHAVLAA
jgi:sulfite reductase beta subunit-like hemoprotein